MCVKKVWGQDGGGAAQKEPRLAGCQSLSELNIWMDQYGEWGGGAGGRAYVSWMQNAWPWFLKKTVQHLHMSLTWAGPAGLSATYI